MQSVDTDMIWIWVPLLKSPILQTKQCKYQMVYTNRFVYPVNIFMLLLSEFYATNRRAKDSDKVKESNKRAF
jgi:hypothetical protein